jgi:hypothetical protein
MKRIASIMTALVLGSAFAGGCSDDESSASTQNNGGGGSGGQGADGGGGSAGGQAGEGGTAGQGGDGGGGMGASTECQECVADLYTNEPTCAATIQPCDDDADCNAWKDCNEACFADDDTVACYDTCDTMYPHDEMLSDPLLECTCDGCGTLCVASCT